MNVVVLVGRLVRDPEIRYTNSQMPICSATLAVDRQVSRDRANEGQQTADFIRITLFGKQAETFQKYLTKGRQVAVEGRIQTGSYKNQNGDTVYTTDVVVNRFDFIGSRNDNNGGGGNYGGGNSYGNGGNQNFGGNGGYNNGGYNGGGYDNGGNFGSNGGSFQQNAPQQSPQNVPEGFSELDDDDIPF